MRYAKISLLVSLSCLFTMLGVQDAAAFGPTGKALPLKGRVRSETTQRVGNALRRTNKSSKDAVGWKLEIKGQRLHKGRAAYDIELNGKPGTLYEGVDGALSGGVKNTGSSASLTSWVNPHGPGHVQLNRVRSGSNTRHKGPAQHLFISAPNTKGERGVRLDLKDLRPMPISRYGEIQPRVQIRSWFEGILSAE